MGELGEWRGEGEDGEGREGVEGMEEVWVCVEVGVEVGVEMGMDGRDVVVEGVDE